MQLVEAARAQEAPERRPRPPAPGARGAGGAARAARAGRAATRRVPPVPPIPADPGIPDVGPDVNEALAEVLPQIPTIVAEAIAAIDPEEIEREIARTWTKRCARPARAIGA